MFNRSVSGDVLWLIIICIPLLLMILSSALHFPMEYQLDFCTYNCKKYQLKQLLFEFMFFPLQHKQNTFCLAYLVSTLRKKLLRDSSNNPFQNRKKNSQYLNDNLHLTVNMVFDFYKNRSVPYLCWHVLSKPNPRIGNQSNQRGG